ncbi:hypothetical protein NDU88_001916 [Pleurodeles waltl]|uniref:Uncharacterized protein n=1 Tax=Pleurodeles waltl TaxID=8319 RepID=A0AAV7KQP4_PLEWA|nr:hypothetical protein NDU88_001916 [Pleurodeles waltl]
MKREEGLRRSRAARPNEVSPTTQTEGPGGVANEESREVPCPVDQLTVKEPWTGACGAFPAVGECMAGLQRSRAPSQRGAGEELVKRRTGQRDPPGKQWGPQLPG